jgi:hypothetical protein
MYVFIMNDESQKESREVIVVKIDDSNVEGVYIAGAAA